jgi:hypothetical protein
MPNKNIKSMSGTELMNEIYSGTIQHAEPELIANVRTQVSDACEELLDMGARIRPLLVGTKRVGWVRGVHTTERKLLSRWYRDLEFIENILLLATSFTRDQLSAMTGIEIFSLARVVKEMTEYDISLAPYMTAYSTTSLSEFQWHGKGVALTSFENKIITMPDGAQIKILAPPHHARLWATLCTYRELNKTRIDNMMNATMIVRPWAGHSVDGFAAELKTAGRLLLPDAIEAWENIVKQHAVSNLNDGWGHPSDTTDGLMRELKGMLSNDKHEKVMNAFARQQIAAADAEAKRLERIVSRRGGPGVTQKEGFIILTKEQVRERERNLRKGRPVMRDTELVENPNDKIKRYQ